MTRRTRYWLTTSGRTYLPTDAIERGIDTAIGLAAMRGWDIDAIYRDMTDAVESGADDSPALAMWRDLESHAIKAATKGWTRIPDDISMGPA